MIGTTAGLSRPVALITRRNPGYVGPPLARLLARRGYDLVLHLPVGGATLPIPAGEDEKHVEELESIGARVEVVREADIETRDGNRVLVDAAVRRFGRLDAACLITGSMISRPFLETTTDELNDQTTANIDSVFHGLQAVLPPMVDAGIGRILVFTSSMATRPLPDFSVYSATRAAANMLLHAVALEFGEHSVSINAIGTNFMDAPGFRSGFGADDPKRRAELEAQVPLRRLGTVEEVAEFAAVLLDGRSDFQTGQFFSLSGGWS